MKNILKFTTGTTPKSSARVVDGKLILSFPHAKRPVVWQMDLTEVKASALEVLEEKGTFALFVKTPKGERVEIAPFETKEEAVEGLMAASHALENGRGQIRLIIAKDAPEQGDAAHNNNVAANTPRKGKLGKWVMALTGIAVVFILFNILNSMSPPPPGTTGASQTAATTSSNPQNSAGVPISADDFLSNR